MELDRYTRRLDALAAALRTAGVHPERSAHLLGAAAAASLDAVALELVLEPRSDARRVAPLPERRPAEPVRLAA